MGVFCAAVDLEALEHSTSHAVVREHAPHRFAQGAVDRFFRPFYGGIFLDRSLAETLAWMREAGMAAQFLPQMVESKIKKAADPAPAPSSNPKP